MLEISSLKKAYTFRGASTPVLNNLSLKVPRGKIFGFLGINGAGKTTTIKIIMDLLFADSGTIKVNGREHNQLETKKLLGFMPEQPQFYLHLTANEVMEFVGELFQIDKAIALKRSQKLLDRVGLKSATMLPVRSFSKGMHQRLAFAVALLNEPKMLIMDEPLDGLDPLGRLDFKRLLLEQKKLGTTIFLSSHILADIEEVCDEVAIIHKGKVVNQGTPNKLRGKYPTLEKYFVEEVAKK